jgi:O-succinylbenzoic acid--CoA ligase
MIVDRYLRNKTVTIHNVQAPWRVGAEWRGGLVGGGHGQPGAGAGAVTRITRVRRELRVPECPFPGCGPDCCHSATRNLLGWAWGKRKVRDLTLTIVTNRSLHAVLVDRPGPRLVELLAAALDGSGPAIAPLDAGLPQARLAALVEALAPGSVEGPDGVTTARSGQEKGVAEGTAVVVATSGSTGVPKGVELSAAALLSSARASLARIGARPGERWLCCLPATYIAGLQVLVRALVSGTDPVLADRADAQTVAACGCAHVSLVPTQLRRLLDVDIPISQDVPHPLAGFRSVLLGGAAAPAGLLAAARAAGVPVVTTYGMTETCGGCVYDGVPLDGVQVRIGDDESIWIGGPVLFSGYVGGPRAPGDGWLRTGDLGRVDAAGRLVVRGRADDVINTGGALVVPGEVAAVLQTCPGVRDVAVLGEPDPEWGERVVAVVAPADPADPPTLELLRLHVKQRLPRYAAPSRAVMVDAVPTLPNGKHDLARLRRELLRWEQIEAESVTK